MTNFEIRPASPSDVLTILGLIRELAEYERLSHEVIGTEAQLHDALFSPKPDAEVRIAWLDNEPIGFALFFHNYSTFLTRRGIYLEDLYIKPEFRGRGFGKRLFIHIAQLAVERGCARFEWAVLDWNAPSIQFYKKLGAKPMDDWTVYRLTGDALLNLAN